MTPGVSLRPAESVLAERAADLLAAGPASAAQLVSHVCQLPGAPATVAEHMARALFQDDARFVRLPDGRWALVGSVVVESADPAVAGTVTVREETSSYEVRSAQSAMDSAVASVPVTSSTAAAGQPFTLHAQQRAADALAGLSFAVVDVETTGTSPLHGDRITEIAVVHVDGGVPTVAFQTLVNPERLIPPYIQQLTRITWDMVRDAPKFRDVSRQVLGALDGRVFVAHNATFDWRFVSHEVLRATGRGLTGPRLCTVRLARRMLPTLRRRNLDSITHYFGIEIPAMDRHRAGGDAYATAHVLVRLLREAARDGVATWSDLERLVARGTGARKRRKPPAMPHSVTDDSTA